MVSYKTEVEAKNTIKKLTIKTLQLKEKNKIIIKIKKMLMHVDTLDAKISASGSTFMKTLKKIKNIF